MTGNDSKETAAGTAKESSAADKSSELNTLDKTFDPQTFLKTVTHRPGVYQMLNDTGNTIYVGKAGNLKKRVSSYFQKDPGSAKTRVMVAQIAGVELIVTNNEIEALILENNLIKEKRPRYNVLLRDDKSYPFVHITTDQEYPRVSYRRGGKKATGKTIGPYPHAGAVKKSLRYIQTVSYTHLTLPTIYSV